MEAAVQHKILGLVKSYARIDYTDDDAALLPLMIDSAAQSMGEVIPAFDPDNMTPRQQLLLLTTVAHLYDNRQLFGQNTDRMRGAAAAMLVSEVYEGLAREETI